MVAAMFCILLFCGLSVKAEFYDTFTGVEIPAKRFEDLRNLSLVPWCAIEIPTCDPHEPRRMDSSCNSLQHPTRGAYLTPFHRMLPADFSDNGTPRKAVSGADLPPPRPLRVALMSDGRAASDKHTQMLVNYAVFFTGDITSVHDTVNYVAVVNCCQPAGVVDPRCAPINVPNDDLHLRRSAVRCLNLTVPITYQSLGCVESTVPPERINVATPMLDLSSVYGNDEAGARRGRLWRGGRLRSEMLQGREWPPNGSPICVNNEPPLETRCHDTPNAGANSLLGINLFFLWFYRQHNGIARALQEMNPCWDDDRLYATTREINIAFANQMYYYEFMPVLLGYDYLLEHGVLHSTPGHVDDYQPSLEPRVSLEFVTGTRWFHVLQEGRLKMYTRDGKFYDEQLVVDYTLRTGALLVNDSLSGLTQGTFRQPGGAADNLVDPDVSERILGRLQFASDVVSSDIAKGRLLGLPAYAQYRRLCGLPSPRSFADLRKWMDEEQVQVFERYYESPEDIDLMAALLAERPMPTLAQHMCNGHTCQPTVAQYSCSGPSCSALVGPTLACVMTDQLLRWRRADRFWYEHPDHPQAFTTEQLYEIRKMTTAKLLCQRADGVSEIQPNAYLLPGHGNEMAPCSHYEMPNLKVFADAACAKLNKSQISDANPFRSYKLQN